MKAAVCHEFGKPLSVEEVNLRAPKYGEVEVKMRACAVCHSDILFAEGAWGGALPAVYGHEGAGHITALGDQVVGYKVGDPVLVTLIRACGHCLSCASGKPTNCELPYDRTRGPLSTLDGGLLEHGMATATFAESAVVDQSQIVRLPEKISMDVASLLSCGVITGVGAVTNTAKVRPGSSVVVIGAGGVGLNTIQGAVICGAVKIIAVDMTDGKLDAARGFGATHGVLANDKKMNRIIQHITDGRGADYVFVTVGVIQAYESASEYMAPGGIMVMVGMPPSGGKAAYEPVMMAAASQSMLGSNMGDTILKRDIPYLIELYRQGRLKLDELISQRYPLEEINEAIADTKAGNARRNVIVFD